MGAAGRRPVARIGDGRGARAVDIGCGVLGWLRLLSEWVGPHGEVVGTDADDAMLAAAEQFVVDERLGNVILVNDAVFETSLEASSFDLVQSRFVISTLARGTEQMATYCRLTRPGGIVALEDWDKGSWHYNPPAPAIEQLIGLIDQAFHTVSDLDGGRAHLDLFSNVAGESLSAVAGPNDHRPGPAVGKACEREARAVAAAGRRRTRRSRPLAPPSR
jgi:SAM-dependent methyltransferase